MFEAEFPESLVALGHHRYASAMKCLASGYVMDFCCHCTYVSTSLRTAHRTVALIDDGLQQWSLHKDLEIILIDAHNPFGNGSLIPTGRLREFPHDALPRADVIIVHHANQVPENAKTSLLSQIHM